MNFADSSIQSRLSSVGIHATLITLKIDVFTYYDTNIIALHEYQIILYGKKTTMLLSMTWCKISRLDFLIRKVRRRLPIRA